MIEIQNIHKKFDENIVLDNISCIFHPGKPNLIIGESGSGKTTLIKVMIGLFSLDSGDIRYNDRIFNNMKIKEKTSLL